MYPERLNTSRYVLSEDAQQWVQQVRYHTYTLDHLFMQQQGEVHKIQM